MGCQQQRITYNTNNLTQNTYYDDYDTIMKTMKNDSEMKVIPMTTVNSQQELLYMPSLDDYFGILS